MAHLWLEMVVTHRRVESMFCTNPLIIKYQTCTCAHPYHIMTHAYTWFILYNITQGLFQDFASEGANAKFQNFRGGKYKAKEGQPYIKRTEKPI